MKNYYGDLFTEMYKILHKKAPDVKAVQENIVKQAVVCPQGIMGIKKVGAKGEA